MDGRARLLLLHVRQHGQRLVVLATGHVRGVERDVRLHGRRVGGRETFEVADRPRRVALCEAHLGKSHARRNAGLLQARGTLEVLDRRRSIARQRLRFPRESLQQRVVRHAAQRGVHRLDRLLGAPRTQVGENQDTLRFDAVRHLADHPGKRVLGERPGAEAILGEPRQVQRRQVVRARREHHLRGVPRLGEVALRDRDLRLGERRAQVLRRRLPHRRDFDFRPRDVARRDQQRHEGAAQLHRQRNFTGGRRGVREELDRLVALVLGDQDLGLEQRRVGEVRRGSQRLVQRLQRTVEVPVDREQLRANGERPRKSRYRRQRGVGGRLGVVAVALAQVGRRQRRGEVGATLRVRDLHLAVLAGHLAHVAPGKQRPRNRRREGVRGVLERLGLAQLPLRRVELAALEQRLAEEEADLRVVGRLLPSVAQLDDRSAVVGLLEVALGLREIGRGVFLAAGGHEECRQERGRDQT